jgi:tetratricopeptide (TPR) repeat protein
MVGNHGMEAIMKSTGIKVGAGIIIGIAIGIGAMKLIESGKDGPSSAQTAELTGTLEESPARSVTREVPKTDSSAGKALDMPAAEASAGNAGAENGLQELMAKVWSGTASPDEELEFWTQLRESDAINEVIKNRENQTPLESDDIDAQMTLADLYVAKILSVTGPEQGLWAMKAEERWRAVLEVDPNHWQARHNVAFSLSQYPDFLNKTGEAISEFEKLVTVQETMEPEPKHAATYLLLYRLYEKRGDRGNAVDALKQGLERFPENNDLIDQWNSVSTLNIP